MKLNSILFFLPLITTIGFTLKDSSGWVLRENKNGIAVYTRYAPGASLKEVRIIDTVTSSLPGVVALLLDAENYPKWVYHCGESKILKVISNKEQYFYKVSDIPWPFGNRDLITDSKIRQDSLTKTVTVTCIAAPDYLPKVKKTVRIIHYQCVYTLTKLKNGKLQIEYIAYGNPGGHIPDWLINTYTVIGTYNSILAMNNRLPLYQSASLSFIKE